MRFPGKNGWWRETINIWAQLNPREVYKTQGELGVSCSPPVPPHPASTGAMSLLPITHLPSGPTDSLEIRQGRKGEGRNATPWIIFLHVNKSPCRLIAPWTGEDSPPHPPPRFWLSGEPQISIEFLAFLSQHEAEGLPAALMTILGDRQLVEGAWLLSP